MLYGKFYILMLGIHKIKGTVEKTYRAAINEMRRTNFAEPVKAICLLT